MRIADGEIIRKVCGFEGNFGLGTELRKWGEVFQRPSNGKRWEIHKLLLYFSMYFIVSLHAQGQVDGFHSIVLKKFSIVRSLMSVGK